MNYSEKHLQAVYEEGKYSAQYSQEARAIPAKWQLEVVVEQRDDWEQSANDETLPPDQRAGAAQVTAYLKGWLSAWD